jgi:hypothetical protein
MTAGRRPTTADDETLGDDPGLGDAAPPPPAAPAAGVVGPALQGLIALVVYVAVFIVVFGQALAAHISTPKLGQHFVDPNLFVWLWQWWPYAISHGLNPLYTHEIGAPTGWNLAAWTTPTPSVALLVSPLTAAFGPITAYNVTLLLAPPTAAWAAFVAARRLTGRFWPALLAGTVYGFNVYELAHNNSGQCNVSVILLFPLMVYLVLLWWDGTLGRTGFMIWMAVTLAAQFYTFTEAFFDVTLVIVAALVVAFLLAGRDGRGKIAWLSGYLAVAYVGAIILSLPYLLTEVLNLPPGLTRNTPNFSLPLSALIVPTSNRIHFWPALSAFSSEHPEAGYVGIPFLILLLVFTITTWKSKFTRLLIIMFVIILILGAGPILVIAGHHSVTLPWHKFWSLPIAKSVEGVRFILFCYLLLALVLAMWLATPSASKLRLAGRWGLAALSLAAIFANLPTLASATVIPPPTWKPAVPGLTPTWALPAFITDGMYRQYLTPGETVLVLSHRGNAGMIFQSDADFYFKIAGGFINASLNNTNALPPQASALGYPDPARERAFFAYAHTAGIRAVIVERAWSEQWMYVFGKLGLPSTTVGGVTIYQINPDGAVPAAVGK